MELTADSETSCGTQFTVAVVSDLHAYTAAKKPDPIPSSATGHFCVDQAQSDPFRHPFAGLRKLITEEALRADVLVCAGDMTEKAEPAPTQEAWRQVRELGNWLGVAETIGVAGNHDLDSRRLYHPFDAFSVVKALQPPFPTPTRELNNQYWAEHFTIWDQGPARFVLLNSAAYQPVADEHKHGRVTPETVDRIKEDLQGREPSLLNILVVHHHPHRFGDIDLEDYSEMTNGQVLLETLGAAGLGPWLILHGHKHWPRLAYAAGGATSPTVMSAGSLTAELYPELALRARNQFYILKLELNPIDRFGLTFAGTGSAWDWSSPGGWGPASPSSGLPAAFGFGLRSDPQIVAREVRDTFIALDTPTIERTELQNHHPTFAFLLPRDELAVIDILQTFGLTVEVRDGLLSRLQLSAESIAARLAGPTRIHQKSYSSDDGGGS